jgi:kynurenine formamidase
MDTPSPSEEATESHLALLGAGIIVVEALANLDKLPPRFTLCCLPLKLVGRDGSPVRAVAVVE